MAQEPTPEHMRDVIVRASKLVPTLHIVDVELRDKSAQVIEESLELVDAGTLPLQEAYRGVSMVLMTLLAAAAVRARTQESEKVGVSESRLAAA